MNVSERAAIVGTIAVVAVAAAGWYWFTEWRDDAATGDGTEIDSIFSDVISDGQLTANAPQFAVGEEVVRDTLFVRVEAAGRAEAFRRATLKAQADGIAMRVQARENRFVRTGAILLEVDTTEYAWEVDQAEANLRTAQADYSQMTIGDDLIEDPELRAERERNALVRSGLEQARVSLAQAKMRLERTRVIAPFSGLLGDLGVVEGQWISSGMDVVTILDPDPIKVETQVLEGDIGRIREGSSATVTFAAFPGETFAGAVATVNPIVSEEKTGRVTVLVPNLDRRIKAGMYADVGLISEALADRIIVPRSAVLERGEGMRRFMVLVAVERDGRTVAERRYVNPGRANDTHFEILAEGPEIGMVQPGETVLVDGHQYLGNGVPITLVDALTAPSAGARR